MIDKDNLQIQIVLNSQTFQSSALAPPQLCVAILVLMFGSLDLKQVTDSYDGLEGQTPFFFAKHPDSIVVVSAKNSKII